MRIIERLRIAGNESLERFDDGTPVRDALWEAADLLEAIRIEVRRREKHFGKYGSLACTTSLMLLGLWLDERLEDHDL